jgi:hypothetical protein
MNYMNFQLQEQKIFKQNGTIMKTRVVKEYI